MRFIYTHFDPQQQRGEATGANKFEGGGQRWTSDDVDDYEEQQNRLLGIDYYNTPSGRLRSRLTRRRLLSRFCIILNDPIHINQRQIIFGLQLDCMCSSGERMSCLSWPHVFPSCYLLLYLYMRKVCSETLLSKHPCMVF